MFTECFTDMVRDSTTMKIQQPSLHGITLTKIKINQKLTATQERCWKILTGAWGINLKSQLGEKPSLTVLPNHFLRHFVESH